MNFYTKFDIFFNKCTEVSLLFFCILLQYKLYMAESLAMITVWVVGIIGG